jgi:hypothetical protein
MSQPLLLWRKVLEATVDTLAGRSRGQYDIRLGRPAGIEEFFAGLPRARTALGGYNVQVPLAAAAAPVSVPATSMTVAYIGPNSQRKDWRIPSQRPESAYPLWREGVGLLAGTAPGEDLVVMVRDDHDVYHARWLRGAQVPALPPQIQYSMQRRTAGVDPIDPADWPSVASLLGIQISSLSDDRPAPTTDARSNGFPGEAYRPEEESLSTPQPDPFKIDPDVMDRGIVGHRKTQNALAKFLSEHAVTPLSHRSGIDPAFDIAWRIGETLCVGEVKSLTASNEEKQLRLALGQVLRYSHQLADAASIVQPVIVTEREPSDPSWATLCERLGVRLMWPGAFAV